MHGLELGGGGSPGSAFASFDSTMSTNLTGLLYSLDISDVAGQPLAITITLGAYVVGLPGWDKTSLENQLRTALGANTISSDYFTDSFTFPDIPIHVPSGDNLVVSTDDVSTAIGSPVPEGGTFVLLVTGMVGALGTCRRYIGR